MGARKTRFPRRRFILGGGVAVAAAGLDGMGQSRADAAVTPPGSGNEATVSDQTRAAHFQAGGGINNALYGTNAAYTSSIPTGVVNTSVGARNLQFSLKYRF